MSGTVHYRVEDRVALLTIDNPPVNTLSQPVRAALLAALDRAGIEDVEAVVVNAAGRTFPAGTDTAEIGRKTQQPSLNEVFARIEALPRPVVAAVHGNALGAGMELALACHYRLAGEEAKLGLPEVTLGLLPGAGGTQRLPRLTGAEMALQLLIGGRPVGADAAAEAGLLDGVVEGDLEGAALSFAQSLKDEGLGPRPTSAETAGFADPVAYMAAVSEHRRALAHSPLLAGKRIVDCVEAALLMPFETGLAFERAAHDDLAASDQSAALRHVFLAERRAGRFPGVEGIAPRPLHAVGIAGGGPLAADIAVALLSCDLAVTLLERDEDALEAGVSRVVDGMDAAVVRGRMSAEQRDRRLDGLAGALDPADFETVDLAIEAVAEDLPAKQAAFAALDRVMKPDAVLATTTEWLDIDLLSAGTGRPRDVIGLHFFAPAHMTRLIEIVVGAETGPEAVATALVLARRLGKIPVRSEMGEGFVANRVHEALRRATDAMLEEGAGVAEIDAAMRAFGFPMGPYQAADSAGLDIAWARRKRQRPVRDPAARYVEIADRLCEAGRHGQKTGRGFYLYPPGGAAPAEDPEVAQIIELERRRKGLPKRRFAPAEIIRRALLAMANEGARLLEERIAQRPADIDLAMVHGFAFPRWRGGPMKWADLTGLVMVRKELRALTPEDPALWTPAGLLTELVKTGRSFDSLNG